MTSHARLSPYKHRQEMLEAAVRDVLKDAVDPVATQDIVAAVRERDPGFVAVSYYDVHRLLKRLEGQDVVGSEQLRRMGDSGRWKRCTHWSIGAF